MAEGLTRTWKLSKYQPIDRNDDFGREKGSQYLLENQRLYFNIYNDAAENLESEFLLTTKSQLTANIVSNITFTNIYRAMANAFSTYINLDRYTYFDAGLAKTYQIADAVSLQPLDRIQIDLWWYILFAVFATWAIVAELTAHNLRRSTAKTKRFEGLWSFVLGYDWNSLGTSETCVEVYQDEVLAKKLQYLTEDQARIRLVLRPSIQQAQEPTIVSVDN
jgi:hypothetical protein